MAMVKSAVWMICRNDGYYIDMAIKSVLSNVDGIYIFDNGSDDNTIEVIESFHSDKIYLEKQRYTTEYGDSYSLIDCAVHPYWRWDEQYDGNSLEAHTRNYAMKRCMEIFTPHWLLNLDADEVVTQLLFNRLNQLDLDIVTSVEHNTDRFIDSQHIAREPNTWGYMRYDPHIRFWNTKTPMKWLRQRREYGHVRIIGPQEVTDGNEFSPSRCTNKWIEHLRKYGEENRIFLYDILHIHLHRMFGPKSAYFFEHYGNNHEFKVKVDFNWEQELPFVWEKWKTWKGKKAGII